MCVRVYMCMYVWVFKKQVPWELVYALLNHKTYIPQQAIIPVSIIPAKRHSCIFGTYFIHSLTWAVFLTSQGPMGASI